MADHSSSDNKSGAFSSPPCFMHEFDAETSDRADAQTLRDVARWRKAERERLIALRLALPVEARREYDDRISETLSALLGDLRGKTVSLYWPFRGEPDLRKWMADVIGRGGAVALPVVVRKGAPLIFRPWAPGCAMERGVWNIPVPKAGPETTPDIVIAPLVGFDKRRYRLGYGGGFYDRTLANAPCRTRVIGVGYSGQNIATIYPQEFDIPMDEIVTETGRAT